jgi:hypothetical protein
LNNILAIFQEKKLSEKFSVETKVHGNDTWSSESTTSSASSFGSRDVTRPTPRQKKTDDDVSDNDNQLNQ